LHASSFVFHFQNGISDVVQRRQPSEKQMAADKISSTKNTSAMSNEEFYALLRCDAFILETSINTPFLHRFMQEAT
jgi:hypothetical protein